MIVVGGTLAAFLPFLCHYAADSCLRGVTGSVILGLKD